MKSRFHPFQVLCRAVLGPGFSAFPSQPATGNGQPATSRSRHGSALIIVLGLLSVLLLMGVAFAVTMRTERQGSANMREAARANHMLDTAIARVMADLDVELRIKEENGRLVSPAVPTNMVVLASQKTTDSTAVNVLSYEMARHLPSDQLACALYSQAYWRPIYGGIKISDAADADPTAEDSPVGRYAYVVLNGCGGLDPNVVGREERRFGLATEEILPGRNASSRVLEVPGNGTVQKFLSQRNKDGHYVAMRDFLRKSVTNIVKNARFNVERAPFVISTNSFSIGSMAIDDPTPPVENGDSTVRLPKVCLVDDNEELLDPKHVNGDKAEDIALAFEDSFYSTRVLCKGDDKLPAEFAIDGTSGPKKFPWGYLAMRVLLDAMDDDVIPGGSKGHNLKDVNKGDYDHYLGLLGGKFEWDRFPCTEPIPMLDNLVVVGGSPTQKGLEYDAEKSKKYRMVYQTPEGGTSYGAPTGAVWTISFSLVNCSVYYPGWNVPDAADGEYTFHWVFGNDVSFDGTDDDKKYKPFCEAMKKVNISEEMNHEVTGKFKLTSKGSSKEPKERRPVIADASDFSKIASFDVVLTWDPNGNDKPKQTDASDWIPESFGLSLCASGFVTGKGGYDNVLQMAPCWTKIKNGDDLVYDDSIEVFLAIDTENMKKSNPGGGEYAHVLGASYCLDPMFAYHRKCWVPTLSYGEIRDGYDGAISEIRASVLTVDDMDGIDDLLAGYVNPLANLYLKTPYRQFNKKTVFEALFEEGAIVGGGSDVMWANPEGVLGNDGDNVDEASYAFYFDSKAPEDSAFRFNRIGQMGFLPIGTYRTIALLDGFGHDRAGGGAVSRVSRQRVLDYFTMNLPREEGSEGSEEKPGDPARAAILSSRLNVNPPRTVRWKKESSGGRTKNTLETDDYNLLPMTAALSGCPLREWSSTSSKVVDWDTASDLAIAFAETLDRKDDDARSEDVVRRWNSDGVAHDIGVLGRCGKPLSNPDKNDLEDDLSWDSILRQSSMKPRCDFDREGIVRNSAGMFTARQQLFTILLKADSFSSRPNFYDAEHGTSLSSVQAIVHVWRDPEPLRDAAGFPVRDKFGNAIHPYVVLDVCRF